MSFNIATEQDIERFRVFSELQARENARLRREMARMANEFAKKEGLDAQKVLEAFLGNVASDVNENDVSSPLTSKSERWSGDDEHGQPKTNKTKKGHGPTEQPDLPTQNGSSSSTKRTRFVRSAARTSRRSMG